MASPPQGDQNTPAHPSQVRERPSWLTDIVVALLLLIADVVIVVVAAMVLVMVGMGITQAPCPSATVRSRDVPALAWLAIWGIPTVAATSAVVYARLRMPVTTVMQTLFTLACTILAVVGTRMLLT
ncbi:hypothetical protein [Streptomyces sp. NPDC093591]|uniref:hypothetical protein n=1 Tax=Streptomyces sp. NPDC093591 TaxID=3366044 RepID=UPI0038194F6B